MPIRIRPPTISIRFPSNAPKRRPMCSPTAVKANATTPMITAGYQMCTPSSASDKPTTRASMLVVGLSLALLGVHIWYPAVIIGVVAFAFTAVGLHIGRRFGALLGKRMEIVGGLILIGIGVRILVDHLF